jgi:hypothetical protein
MSEQFDPYYEWLGIKPEDQPANRYQLLGVEIFESDPVALRRAADERMTYVRTFATGRHAKLTQKILNELAAAKVCLLDDNKRAAYDETLKSPAAPPPPRAAASGNLRPATAPGPPVPPAPPPTAPPVAVGATAAATEAATDDESEDHQSPLATVATRTSSYPSRRRRSKSGAGGIILGAAIVVMLVVGGIAAMNLANKPADVSLDNGGSLGQGSATDGESATDVPPEDFQPAPPTEKPPEKPPKKPPKRRPKPRLESDLPAAEPSKPLLEETWPDPIRLPETDQPKPRVEQPKQPVPDAADVQQAIRQLDDSFHLDAPRSADEKRALARELYDESLLRSAAIEQFALLDQARNLAVSVGDLQTALQAAREQDRLFVMDHLAVLTDIVTAIDFSDQQMDQIATLAVVGFQLVEKTLAADRFELANRITDYLGKVVRRAGSPEDTQKLQDTIVRIRLLQRPFEQIKDAFEALADAPDDPAANTAVGRYYCFIKGDWKTGLPYLAKGDHAAQKKLSQRELADAQAPDAAIEIADGWSALAGDDDGLLAASVSLQKENLLRHALSLYERNVTRLPDSKRQHAQSQIEELTRQLDGGASSPQVSRSIWYMQDVSMKPFPIGERGEMRQTTDDPRAPFRGQGVYFDPSGRRRDLMFQVDWDKRVRAVHMRAKNLRNFRIQFLTFDGKRLIGESTVVRFSSELQSIDFNVPSNVGSRFCLRLHNEADGWFYLDRVELRTAP